MEVSFYQLMITPLEKTLPKLLEKVYSSSQRAIILCDTQERLELLNSTLWTYSTPAFLPHGTRADPAEFHYRQPIWLTTEIENPNQATLICVTSGEFIENQLSFTKCLDIFDGNNSEMLIQAHNRYQQYQTKGFVCNFWRQTIQGSWEKV